MGGSPPLQNLSNSLKTSVDANGDLDVDVDVALTLFQFAKEAEISSFFISAMIEEGKCSGGKGTNATTMRRMQEAGKPQPKLHLHLLPLLLLPLLP